MTLLDEALDCSRLVVSVMGEHAGEGVNAIFTRKMTDISRTGQTFWLIKSPKARPLQVQELCRTSPAYTIFVEPATQGGARPTSTETAARDYSVDRVSWLRLPAGIGPVTGKVDTTAAALVFDRLETGVSGTLDLWGYGDYLTADNPLKFALGCSTVCAVRKNMATHADRMKSRYRQVLAVARLATPYGVWLR